MTVHVFATEMFAPDDLISAVGITMEGRRIILGFVEAATERMHV